MTEQVIPRYTSRAVWLYWTLATAVSVAVVSLAFTLVQGHDFAWLFLAGLFGLATGIAQSLALWQTTRVMKRWTLIAIPWILANIIGWFIGIAASGVGVLLVTLLLYFLNVGDYALVYQVASSPLPMVLAGLFGGLGLGLVEQRLFRARSLPVSQWTRTSTIAWCVAGFVGWAVGSLVPGRENVQWLVGGAVAGIVAGAITGETLSRVAPTWIPERKANP